MTDGLDSAFPFVVDDISKNQCTYSGLTKREYFAALVMQGYAANSDRIYHENVERNAEWAIQQADALIAKLSKETGATHE